MVGEAKFRRSGMKTGARQIQTVGHWVPVGALADPTISDNPMLDLTPET